MLYVGYIAIKRKVSVSLLHMQLKIIAIGDYTLRNAMKTNNYLEVLVFDLFRLGWSWWVILRNDI